MNPRHIAPTLILTLIATGAIAHDGVKDPEVKARMMLMEQIKQATGTLGSMAKDPSSYSKTKAEAAQADLASLAAKVPAAFQSPASDPKSEASPKIWENWGDFTAKANALTAAAQAMDAGSAQGVAAGMGAIGTTCGGCHKSYRE